MYLLREAEGDGPRVQLFGSGTILREVEAAAAAELLREDFGVAADVWSVTSFSQLQREGAEADRWSLLHPNEERRASFVETSLDGHEGPVVAATDYIRAFPEMVRPYVPRRYRVLGTDGFGRSDYRVALRRFFEVDCHHLVLAAVRVLADEAAVDAAQVAAAIERYDIDTEAEPPWRR